MEEPRTPDLIIESIPATMQDVPCWVCWKYVQKDGKWTKVPLNPHTGQRASTINPETWSDIDTAVRSVKRLKASGIGFVFSDDYPFIGVDIDKAISEDGVIDAVPQIVLRGLNSYTERSPSGRGYHVIITGELPAAFADENPAKSGKKTSSYEVYRSRRFFTMTGDSIHEYPSEPRQRSNELAALWRVMFLPTPGAPEREDSFQPKPSHNNGTTGWDRGNDTSLSDTDILRIARASKSGHKFASLFDRGDTSEYGGDDSAADLALCNMLAFYTDDREQVERLVGLSPLGHRSKWSRPDYRDLTINAAYAGRSAKFRSGNDSSTHQAGTISIGTSQTDRTESGAKSITQGEGERNLGPQLIIERFDHVEEQEIDWIWPGWMAKGKIHILGGHPGDGKSTITTALASSLSTGGLLPDNIHTSPILNTLILAAEDHAGDTIKPRLRIHGADMTKVFHIPAVIENNKRRGVSVIRHIDEIQAAIIEHNIGLLIIDPITNYMSGSDRNSEGDVRDALMPINEIAQTTGLCVLCVMHVGKPSGGPRRPLQSLLGSTAFGGVARNVWMVAPMPENEFEQEEESDHKILGVVKSNIANASMTPPIEWSRPQDEAISWHGVSNMTIEDVTSGSGGQIDRAIQFITTRLKDGADHISEDLQKEAKEEYEISVSTFRRALKKMGIKPRKGYGHDAPWYISMRPRTPAPTHTYTLPPTTIDHLDHVDLLEQVDQVGNVTNLTMNQGDHLTQIASKGNTLDFSFDFEEE